MMFQVKKATTLLFNVATAANTSSTCPMMDASLIIPPCPAQGYQDIIFVAIA